MQTWFWGLQVFLEGRHCASLCIDVHLYITHSLVIIREVGFLHPSGVDTLLTLLDAIVLSQKNHQEENRFRSALGGGDTEFLYKQYQTGVVTCDIYERFWLLSVCLLFDSDFRAMKRHSSESFKLWRKCRHIREGSTQSNMRVFVSWQRYHSHL